MKLKSLIQSHASDGAHNARNIGTPVMILRRMSGQDSKRPMAFSYRKRSHLQSTYQHISKIVPEAFEYNLRES